MGKAIADPLFLFLVLAVCVQVALYRDWPRLRRMSGFARIGLPVLTLATVGLGLLGTHVAESYLIDRLSRVHPIPGGADVETIDVVVVLSGGFVDARAGVDPTAEYSQPDWWSTARTVQGARTFIESDARLFVVSGYWGAAAGSSDADTEKSPRDPARPKSARLAYSMKALAVQLGVPPNRIVVEPNARTTRQHPLELIKLGVVSEGETVGVVTSSWHLPRAMREFQKHFSRVVAVPAFDTAVNEKRGLLRWLPRSRSLASSATALAEYVGMVWYRFSF